MLGTLRLLLALAVAFSHIGGRVAGLNPGVMAVVVFYLISGYVMTGLLRRHYCGLSQVHAFYLDRALRLFPQYLCILLASFLLWKTSAPATPFLQGAASWTALFNNLCVIPLNYFMWNHSDSLTLIPPAWSLGAELQFYLLMPFLLLLRLRAAAFVLALSVYLLAAIGVLDTDFFGYRLLPGVLVFFLLGSALYDQRARPVRLLVPGVCACALLLAGLWGGGHLGRPYNLETLLGLAGGLMLLAVLGTRPTRPWDQALGDLSYGVFLNHFLLQWIGWGQPRTWAGIAGYLLCSMLLSWVTQRFIERPALRLRYQLRRGTHSG